jgi:hypothetical protein
MRLAQSIAAALLVTALLAEGAVVGPQAFAKGDDPDDASADAADSDDDAEVPDPDDPDGNDGSLDESEDEAPDGSDEGVPDSSDDEAASDETGDGATDETEDVASDDSGGDASGTDEPSRDDDSSSSNSGSGTGDDDSSGSGDDDSGSSNSGGSSGSDDGDDGDDDSSGSSDDSGSSNSGSSSGSDDGDDSSGSSDDSGSSNSGSSGSDDSDDGDDDSSGSSDNSGSSNSGSDGGDGGASGASDNSGSSDDGKSSGSSDNTGTSEGDSAGKTDDDRSGRSDDDEPASAASDDNSDTSEAELPTSHASEIAVEVEYLGGGEESETQRVALDEKDGIETDRDGFRYRRNEFVALDLDEDEISTLRKGGFTVLQSQRLESAGGTVHLVKGPSRLSDADAFTVLDGATDPDSLSFNHLFDSSSGEVRKQRAKSVRPRSACGCQIGMIDTGVANRLAAFSHVTIEQRAFNSDAVSPRQHGTAVAHQFAGTTPLRERPTKIVVADIFSGQRASAGSTFALVRALDWLATKGVGVINVSLAGPRNAVVAGTIERLEKRGHIIVAAAGNDGPAAPPVFPGAYVGVVAVTAVDAQRQVYRYANRGPYVDFAAPGVAVPAINTRGEATVATGTSFASPAVAARLARIVSTPDPAASARAVSRLVGEAQDLGKPGRDAVFGYGLVEDDR